MVLGARQVGKTTLVEHCLAGEQALFLNFDVEIDKQRFLAATALAPKEGLASLGNPKVLVIDEAQRLPEAARLVKGWYDVRLPVKILLLGSSSLNLLDQAAESLTGRNQKLRLPPLVLEEALEAQSWFKPNYTPAILQTQFAAAMRTLLMQLMSFGGYPEVVLSSDKPRLLREISSDYLWKDVLQMGMVKSPDLIKRLLTLLAHQVGNEVSTQELATQLQIARPTVDRYLDLLEQTYVIFRLPSYSTNPRKEVVRASTSTNASPSPKTPAPARTAGVGSRATRPAARPSAAPRVQRRVRFSGARERVPGPVPPAPAQPASCADSSVGATPTPSSVASSRSVCTRRATGRSAGAEPPAQIPYLRISR